jgi:hypothetical protein
MYKVELLTGERDRSNDRTMAESYVRTALELREISERGFFDRFSGETARVCSGCPSLKPDDVARRVLDLHQRHGQSIWDVLNAAIRSHSAELVMRSLPSSSVLMMTVAPGRAPALARVSTSTDPLMKWIEEDEPKSTSVEADGGRYKPDTERPPDEITKAEDLHEGTAGARLRTIAQNGRSKSRPARERARGVIRELYPKGVPGQDVEPNVNLCRRVGDKLKQAGLLGVSNDTILRAAGRRR